MRSCRNAATRAPRSTCANAHALHTCSSGELFTARHRRDALSAPVAWRTAHAAEDGAFHRFEQLFEAREGKLGVVVTFLSILELAKERLLDIVQEAPLAPIYVKSLAVDHSGDAPLEFASEFDDDIDDAAGDDAGR